MSLKDIEKLREKVEKDPNSKLFVPLAEEYRKEGMVDEAISVLLSGLEKQPIYMSARVSLGKIYLEKKMPGEAQSEFEQVIKLIPDNLYAHKKLAEIYRATGDTQQAIKSYKTILRLNAMDEEALINLSELEVAEQEESQRSATAAPSVAGFVEESDAVKEENRKKDLAAFQSALSGNAAEDLSASPADLLAPKVDPHEAVVELPIDAEITDLDSDNDLAAFQRALFGNSAEDLSASPADLLAPKVDTDEAVVEFPVDTEVTVFKSGNDSGDESDDSVYELDELQEDAFELCPLAPSAEEAIVPDVFVVEQINDNKPQETAPGTKASQAETAPVADVTAADRKISEGNYGDAMKIYRKLLTANPDNRQVLQRVEDLRQLLKMIGKDKETLIDQLNSFMEGIEKRRNEFFRNT